MWKIFLKITIPGYIIGIITASAVSISFSWLMTGHFDRTFAFVPERFMYVIGINIYIDKKLEIIDRINFKLFDSLPWNQNSFRGYIFEIVFYSFTGLAFFITFAMLLLPFVSICWHHQTFYEMFCHLLQQLGNSDPNAKRGNRALLERLIRFHVSVKV